LTESNKHIFSQKWLQYHRFQFFFFFFFIHTCLFLIDRFFFLLIHRFFYFWYTNLVIICQMHIKLTVLYNFCILTHIYYYSCIL
jgi:hypothetical protein